MKYEIETTNIFDTWFAGVKDSKSKAQIISRFDKVQLGNFGDHKSIIDVPIFMKALPSMGNWKMTVA
jgi:putative addiction module killer protein